MCFIYCVNILYVLVNPSDVGFTGSSFVVFIQSAGQSLGREKLSLHGVRSSVI